MKVKEYDDKVKSSIMVLTLHMQMLILPKISDNC